MVLTADPVLAYTLSMVFYHRQSRHARRTCDTFHELAKSFAYWFLVSSNTS